MQEQGIMTFFLVLALLGLLGWHIYQRKLWQTKERDLRQKVDSVSEGILAHLPLGVAVVDAKGYIHWHNSYFSEMIGREKVLKGRISQYLPNLAVRRHSWFPRWQTSQMAFQNHIYRVESEELEANGNILFIFEDITERVNLEQSKTEERPVIGFIQIDNFTEVVQGVEEGLRPVLLAAVDRVLTEWAIKMEGYLKKFAEDRYLLVISQGALRESQKTRFEIIDRVREMELGNKIPVTLSIGIGVGEETIADLARQAQAALDLALGRGGDQVVVKWTDQVLFYGGTTRPLEKKTKVRARVVAYTLKQYIQQASNVIVMGHEGSDLDSAGASLGVAKIAMDLGKTVYVLLDNTTRALDRLLETVQKYPEYEKILVTGKEALSYVGKNTLLVICDTSKPSLLVEPAVLSRVGQVVLIDHHRRAQEFIKEAQLVYVESYASSTSEMVTEIIQYLSEEVSTDVFSASALLAGILVDTKNFVSQAGVRTFEAAGFLRRAGADPVLVRRLLQDDFQIVLKRAQVVKDAEMIAEHVAISVVDQVLPQGAVIAAQAADILLSVEDVDASFVLYPTADGVKISGRSNGELNVQVLLERLGGGGHLSVAGAQIKGVTMEQAKEQLITALKVYLEENS